MNRESVQPLARRAIAVLTDPRTIRAGTSVVYPAVMSALIGVTGLFLNAVFTALAVWPVRQEQPPVYLLTVFLVFVVGLPSLYFFLGARYGLARAAFSIYTAARPAVIDLVIQQVRQHVRGENAETREEKVPDTPDDEPRERIPRAMRWLVRAILTIAGAGDRLTDAVAEIDRQEHPKTVIVGAIVDDLVVEHVVAPARDLIILTAIVNAALLVALFLMV